METEAWKHGNGIWNNTIFPHCPLVVASDKYVVLSAKLRTWRHLPALLSFSTNLEQFSACRVNCGYIHKHAESSFISEVFQLINKHSYCDCNDPRQVPAQCWRLLCPMEIRYSNRSTQIVLSYHVLNMVLAPSNHFCCQQKQNYISVEDNYEHTIVNAV